MGKSKAKMPKELEKQCHMVIHAAAAAAGAGGAVPIPMADTVPITAAQIAMIVKLGQIFDVALSESVAKSIIAGKIAQTAGRAIATNVIKMIPGAGTIIGGVVSASTAAVITEGMGWTVADDFYRMSLGKEPENFLENAEGLEALKELFADAKVYRR